MMNFLINTYYEGLTCVLIGTIILIWTMKDKDRSFGYIFHPFIEGLISSIGFILLGLDTLYTVYNS